MSLSFGSEATSVRRVPNLGHSVTRGGLLEGGCVPSLGFSEMAEDNPSSPLRILPAGTQDLGCPNPVISTEAPRNPQPFHHRLGPEPGSQAPGKAPPVCCSWLDAPRGRGRRCPGHFQFLEAGETPWRCLAPTCPETGSRVAAERGALGPAGPGSRQSHL